VKTPDFAGRLFHGKNQCDIIGLIPSETDFDDFKYPCSFGDQIEVARLQLLFDFTILPDPQANGMEADLVQAAFVQRLAPFADDRGFPLYEHDGRGNNKQCKSASLGFVLFYNLLTLDFSQSSQIYFTGSDIPFFTRRHHQLDPTTMLFQSVESWVFAR
jgi:hypothetical protein